MEVASGDILHWICSMAPESLDVNPCYGCSTRGKQCFMNYDHYKIFRAPLNVILMPPNGEHQLEKKKYIFDFCEES